MIVCQSSIAAKSTYPVGVLIRLDDGTDGSVGEGSQITEFFSCCHAHVAVAHGGGYVAVIFYTCGSNVRKTVEVGGERDMCGHKFHNSPSCDRC